MRIAQEALNNIARHAQAQHVKVTLEGSGPVRLVISDDGQGFDPHVVGRTSFGLMSMRERAAKINASLDVKSVRGQGTEIVVVWPAEAELA
jgi:signal transduction histidine kinase